MDTIKVGTEIKTEKVTIRIVGIEVREFIGEWDTYIIYDWRNRETGETKFGLDSPLSSMLSSLRKHKVIPHAV